jgi:hypothetical protein
MKPFILGAAMLLFAACGSSKEDITIGASCNNQGECRFMCEMPSDTFPNGFCTIGCADDRSCPRAGTACVAIAGGVCMFTCSGVRDCQFLGSRWTCSAEEHMGGGPRVSVCIGGR